MSLPYICVIGVENSTAVNWEVLRFERKLARLAVIVPMEKESNNDQCKEISDGNGDGPMRGRFGLVKKLLEENPKEWFGQSVQIHHVDITCDGCEMEPIIGNRFRCSICDDIDLCEACTRALLLARIKLAEEVGTLPEPAPQVCSMNGVGTSVDFISMWIISARVELMKIEI